MPDIDTTQAMADSIIVHMAENKTAICNKLDEVLAAVKESNRLLNLIYLCEGGPIKAQFTQDVHAQLMQPPPPESQLVVAKGMPNG